MDHTPCHSSPLSKKATWSTATAKNCSKNEECNQPNRDPDKFSHAAKKPDYLTEHSDIMLFVNGLNNDQTCNNLTTTYVVRNAGCARSRYTLKLSLIFSY